MRLLMASAARSSVSSTVPIRADADRPERAGAYVECIAQLYSGEYDLAAMSEAAFDCIATRHTRDELARRVAGLLAPSPTLASAAA